MAVMKYAKEDVARPAQAGGGGSKGNDTLRNAALDNNKNQNVLSQRLAGKNRDEMGQGQQSGMPAWMDVAQNAWNVASPLLAGPAGVPSAVSQFSTMMNPYIASMLPAGKGNDQLAPGSPNKNKDQLGRMSGRTMFGPGLPGTLDPALLAQQNAAAGGGGSSFASRYGGNWNSGGGGNGYGAYDYSNGNYPAWLKSLMGLYSWNIK